MKKYTWKNLNIKRLLTLGDLDIRSMAAKDAELTADKYFSKVEQFIEIAPQFRSILLNITKLSENIKALKELEAKLGVSERPVAFSEDTKKIKDLIAAKTSLSEIGYDKLNFDIDALCNALNSSNLQLTENIAKKLLMNFDLLFTRLKSAYTVKKFVNPQAENETAGDLKKVLLSEALAYFDHEEANRKMRILAVDDVPIILNMLTSVLSPHYEVFALKSGAQIEKVLAHTTPELFLLDIEMQDMNGFDIVPIIRRFKEHKETPIIFLTGNASYDNLKEAVSVGACDFITKPVDTEILLEKISKNIVRKKAY